MLKRFLDFLFPIRVRLEAAARRADSAEDSLAEAETRIRELQFQVDQLRISQLPVDRMTEQLFEAIEAGEAQLHGRVVSQVEAEFKGELNLQGGAVGLHFRPYGPAEPHTLSLVRLVIDAVPGGLYPQYQHLLRDALEQLQAALLPGAFPDAADQLTALLAEFDTFTSAAILDQLRALTQTLSAQIEQLPPGSDQERLTVAVQELASALAGSLPEHPTIPDYNQLVGALTRLSERLQG